MSLGNKVLAAPARLWMNWPLWGGLLVILLLAKHTWVLFAPTEHAVPSTTASAGSAQTEQLFGTADTKTSSSSLNGIRPIGIFASGENGFAVLQTERGQLGVGVGHEVMPGIVLVETQADYVVLEQNGSKHKVELSKANAPSATNAQTTNQVTPAQQTILQQVSGRKF